MPRKIRSYGNPIKPVIQQYSEDEDKSRFVFTVDPQCIVTFPIDHSLYVCDICSSVLKTRDSFKKHYIKFHINHAHATLSDLKCCGALPINLSNFKEDEGCFRCHFCIGLFFPEKSDLKKHLNQHDILTDEQNLDSEDSIQKQNIDIVENKGEAVTSKMKPCNQTESSEISVPLLELNQCKEPVIITTLSDFLPLSNPNIPTPSGFLNSLPELLVTSPPKCNPEEVPKEPLSSLLGLSLLTLFNTPTNLLPDTISSCVESTSSAQGGRCSSPIFAQDCTTSNSVQPVATFQSTSEYLSSYHTLALGEVSNSSSLSSLGSTEDIPQFTENDLSEKSEEIFSSLTSSRSDSDEEISTVDKNMVDNIDNIVLACLFCDRIFANIKSRRISWECVFCKTNFNKCDSLLNHLCSNHSDIFLTCISCKVRFDTKAFMDTHFQNKHKSENITHNDENLSELHNKDALLHQLKCIPYYTNENIYYSLSRKIKLFVFNKLSPSNKRHNLKQVTDQAVQVLKDDLPQDCQTKSSEALNYIGSILKRKLSKDQSKLPTLPHNKIVKLNKDFNELAIENNYQSLLPVSPSQISPSIESIQEVGVDRKNAFEYHVETDVKLEFDSINRQIQIFCLYCSKISFSVKGNNTHIARIHKMRRGGKYCSFCATNFKTLDLLFSHLCSKHINVYFACVICRERFDSKHSLLMHFDTEHDSVDINKGTENLHDSSSDHNKELFMFELKCLPSYPFKPICSTDCKMCRSPSVEKVLQALAMNMTIKISNNTLPFQVEDKIKNSKSKHDQSKILVNFKYPSLLGDNHNCLKSQNQMDYKICKPNLQEDTGNGPNSKLSLIFDKPENKPIVESIDSTRMVTETNLGLSSVEDSMKHLVSTEMPNLDTEYNTCSITSSSIETDLNIMNCLFCDKTFVKAKAYRVHLYRSHKAKKNKCMFCNIEFNYYEDLFAHLLLTHSDVYIACEICKIRFNASSALNKHEDNVHKPEQAKESNDVIDDVPILTKVLEIDEPKCVPQPINDPLPCLEFKRDNKCPPAELGLQPRKIHEDDENKKDEEHTSVRRYGHQLINFSHPQYENIAKKNYAYLDITVQLQVLARLKEFTHGKQDATQYPQYRPLKPQKTSGVGGKREFSGEWARSKNYFCANCGSHFVNFWDFDAHRWNAHPNVACSVFDFYVEDTPPCFFEAGSWPYNRIPKQTTVLVNIPQRLLNVCSKCGKSFVNSLSFHKHLISCSQHNKLIFKPKRSISWKEPDETHKRKRRSCRGLKSILDTPPKLPPTLVFNSNSQARIKPTNGVPKRLLSDKTNRRLSFNNESARTVSFADNKHELMLTRSRSVISNIDEKTKELIEKFERGKYNYIESFTRRLTKPVPKKL